MPALNIFMRFLHMISAILLLGGAFAWRFAEVPAERALAPDLRGRFGNAMAAAWRPFVVAAVAGLLISGIWNFLQKTGLTPVYHAIFGIKVLLALDVFAASILAVRAVNPKRSRQWMHVAAAGIAIVILSAILRSLSLH